MENTAYNEGFVAGCCDSETKNPYLPYSSQWEDWEEGYKDAQDSFNDF